MKIKVNPDGKKSKFLKENAIKTLKRLNETNKLEYPTNTLLDYYNIIQYLLERICFLKGEKIIGEGKHIELINIAKEEKIINEKEKIFLNRIRDKRNRINYEGNTINKEFIEHNEEKIIEIIKKLKEIN